MGADLGGVLLYTLRYADDQIIIANVSFDTEKFRYVKNISGTDDREVKKIILQAKKIIGCLNGI